MFFASGWFGSRSIAGFGTLRAERNAAFGIVKIAVINIVSALVAAPYRSAVFGAYSDVRRALGRAVKKLTDFTQFSVFLLSFFVFLDIGFSISITDLQNIRKCY